MDDKTSKACEPEPIRRGRPRSPEPLIPASTRLHPTVYDRLSRRALRLGQSESAYIRNIILIHLGGS